MSELPPGFVLDEAPATAVVPSRAAPAPTALPDGFVLDAQEASAEAPSKAQEGGWANLHWPTMPSMSSVLNGVMNGATETATKPTGGLTLSGLAKGVYDQGVSAATLPRDVLSGAVDPKSDEAIRRSFEFAGMASPITPAARIAQEVPAAAIAAATPTARDAADMGITLTAGQRSGDPALLTTENTMLGGGKGPSAQRVAQDAVDQQKAEIAGARDAIGETAGRGEADLARAADAGDVVTQGVKQAAQSAKADYQQRYADAFAQPGDLAPEAFKGIGPRIADNLAARAEPVILDPTLTPAATRALAELDGIGNLKLGVNGQPGAADEIVGVNLRGVDQARRRLAAYSTAAKGNPADQRAVGAVIHEFDGQIQTAMENGLFSGADDALSMLKDARSAFASYQRTFKPRGSGDDVGNALRAITERDATPEQVANYLYGASKTGAAPLSVRLADRLKGILGEESPDWAAVRQGAWQRVTGPADMGAKRSSDRILDFVDGEGKSLSTRLFSEPERAEMRKLANVMRAITTKPGTFNASNSGNRLAGIARQTFGAIGSMLGATAAGPVGAGAGFVLGRGAEAVSNARAASQARQLFSGQAPITIGQRISQATAAAGRYSRPGAALPLARDSGPMLANTLGALRSLQGPVPGRAEDKQR